MFINKTADGRNNICGKQIAHYRKASGKSQRELADEFDISPACVARALKSLVSEGYILRTGNEDDQRRNDVSITEKGLNVIQDSQRTFEQVDQQAFAGFETDELRQLIALFTRIQQNLREGEAIVRSNH